MTDQPTKTKQQLLAELESIMSMLDDDAVIPTLDTVVEPSANKEPSASQQEPSADQEEPSADEQKPSADQEKPSEEAKTSSSISEQLNDETQATEASAEVLEDRQQLTSELDDELRQAMEIDIKIPEVKVPNSQTLFGIEDSDTSSSDNNIETTQLPLEATLEPEKPAHIDTKNSELENTDLETQDEELQPYGNPKDDTAEPFAVEESHDIYTPEEGLISDKLIAAANAQLQSQKDSDTTLPQQNPFPAPNRKIHLFNGEAQAEAPLPGQQHLFDHDNENATNSDEAATHQVTTHQVTTHQNTTAQESAETVSEEPLAKPQNPFKSSSKSGSAYPPASLLNSMRRPKPQQAVEPSNSANDVVESNEKPKASPFEQQESLSLSQATEQVANPDDIENNPQVAVEAIDIDAMVDKLIQEQLPKLEAELRKRLTQALSAELEL